MLMGTRNGLWDFNIVTGNFSGFRPLAAMTGGSGISSWACDDEGNVWIGTMSNGLWLMDPAGKVRMFYRAANPAQNRINSIALDGEYIWLATLNGVVRLDRETGAMQAGYTTWEMLPHNNVSQVVVNRHGEVLVATETDRLCYIHITGGEINIECNKRLPCADNGCPRLGQLAGTIIRFAFGVGFDLGFKRFVLTFADVFEIRSFGTSCRLFI